jgi:hypothetical protein
MRDITMLAANPINWRLEMQGLRRLRRQLRSLLNPLSRWKMLRITALIQIHFPNNPHLVVGDRQEREIIFSHDLVRLI